MKSVYTINKGVGKPVVFKGLTGNYIWLMGVLLVLLLLQFSLLYLIGVPLYLIIIMTVLAFGIGYRYALRICSMYGEHGWMKQNCSGNIPKRIKGFHLL